MALPPPQVGEDLQIVLFKPVTDGETRRLLPNLSILTKEPVTSVTSSVI